MNIILFEESELKRCIPHTDPRIVHISKILGLTVGDEFSAGIIGGKCGRAVLETKNTGGYQIRFQATEDAQPPHPITILIGCPRPPVARRLIRDLTAMGLSEIRFCSTDLAEKSYLCAKLWKEALWKEAIIAGGMQGGSTHLPSVGTFTSLIHALENLSTSNSTSLIALDNSISLPPLSQISLDSDYAILAIGPERGWSDNERKSLQKYGFRLTRLGSRILRTETACLVGVGLIFSHWGVY